MIRTQCDHIHLKLLPLERYIGVDRKDPIRFYRLPVIGRLYQRRIELCLEQLSGGIHPRNRLWLRGQLP